MASRAQSSFALPANVWTGFVRRHWKKSPLVLERPFPIPMTTSEAVYDAVVQACELFRGEPLKGPVKLFVEDAMLQGGIRQYLPGAQDRSLERYTARIARRLGGRRFGLRFGDYTSFDERAWFHLRDFLRPLFDVIGIPGTPTEAALFLGDYARTPFGIHRDFHETFAFVILGRKRFRIWPPGFLEKNPDLTRFRDYDAFLGEATTLEGGPGDVLYWPSDHWHVGESAGGLTISLNIAVTPDAGPPLEMLRRSWRAEGDRFELPRRPRDPSVRPKRLQQAASATPRSIEATARSWKRVVDSAPFRSAVLAEWLDRATSLGIESLPPSLPWQTLKDDDLIRLDPHYPVLFVPAGNHQMICSANGHSFSIVAHPRIRNLFEELNRGEVSRVRDLMKRFSGSVMSGGVHLVAHPGGVRDILEKLFSLRGRHDYRPGERKRLESISPPSR